MGQGRLRTAIDRFTSVSSNADNVGIQVEWKPFQIDPGTAMQGEDMEAYCRRRWGSSGWTRSLRTEGAQDGAKFANWKWWPNTARAHQWIQYATTKFNSNESVSTDHLNHVLFRAMYEQGANLSNIETLVDLGERTFGTATDKDGNAFSRDDLTRYLQNNEGLNQVRQEIDSGRRKYRISGVPFFLVSKITNDDNKQQRPYAFSGAQKPDTLVGIFQELADGA